MPLRRSNLAIILATALAFGIPMTSSAHPQSSPAYGMQADSTLLSVSASADATRIPDVATISTGVITQAADANAAMRANATQMDKVMAAIRKAGIAERDVQTSGISLNPQYKYADNVPPQITGYQASNTVNIKVRDMFNAPARRRHRCSPTMCFHPAPPRFPWPWHRTPPSCAPSAAAAENWRHLR